MWESWESPCLLSAVLCPPAAGSRVGLDGVMKEEQESWSCPHLIQHLSEQALYPTWSAQWNYPWIWMLQVNRSEGFRELALPFLCLAAA